MIPTILIMFLRRNQNHHPGQFLLIKNKLWYVGKTILISLVALSVFALANSQEINLAYTIKRHGGQIGYMNVKEVKAGSKTSYKLESLIKTKFIFTFTAKSTEEAATK